jgi:hypothetical protein
MELTTEIIENCQISYATKRLGNAVIYFLNGFSMLPIASEAKGCTIKGWPDLSITEAELPQYFAGPGNIGVRLGKASGGLCDVDLDSPEAITIADRFLPPTPTIFGRKSKPRSHRLYLIEPTPTGMKFEDPLGDRKKATLVELRANAKKNGSAVVTVIPPGTHESGEPICWQNARGLPIDWAREFLDLSPARLPADRLQTALTHLAVASLVIRYWPRPHGNDLVLALSGALLRSGLELDRVKRIIGTAAKVAGYQRFKEASIDDTARNLAAGREVTGWPTLAEFLSGKVVDEMWKWLGKPDRQERVTVEGNQEEQAEPNRWPEDPDPAACYGLAGEFVRALEPHTEASSVALLIQFLLSFGNVIGRSAHFRVEADHHYTNENVVLVGESAKSRKGTSESRVRALFAECDPQWARTRVLGGLSSGEGLIWAVRDAIWKQEPIRQKKRIVGYQAVQVDEGIADKRLHVFESEFAVVLKMLERDGNILSPMIRQAWDAGHLQSLTKNSPAVATGAHISMCGHITVDELRRYLSMTEQGNGFGNRFIWQAVRRSQFLPEGGDLEACQRALAPIIEKVKQAVEFGKQAGELVRSAETREEWRAVYRDLSGGRPGLLGAVTSRAEAHVVRLSSIYALLDESTVIQAKHLEAALALWEYAEASCKYIFGDLTGDPNADVILKTLRSSPIGMTRTEIGNNIFAKNKPSAVIARALDSLLALGLIRREQRETEGRTAQVWFAV